MIPPESPHPAEFFIEARIVLSSNVRFLSAMRHTIGNLTLEMGWNESESRAITLAVEEALTNKIVERNRRPDSLRLLQGFPENARDEELYLLLIEANQDTGSVDEVSRLVERALKRYPGSARVNAWMGFEMRRAARFTEAQSYLRKAMQQDPALPAPYFLMGDVLVKTEKYAEAMPWLRKAIQLEPDDTEAAIDLSRALIGLGDIQGAVTELERAFRSSPENANLAVELARAYARAGDSEKARLQAETAGRLRHRENVFPDSLRLEKRR